MRVFGFVKISFLIFIFGIFLSFVSAQSLETNGLNEIQSQQPSLISYYTSEQTSTYWPVLDKMQNGDCGDIEGGTDFIVQIRPGSCQPSVVRSDLLEEQNVPVFCQLDAVKINPLIDVSAIKSITFKGDYSKYIAGVGFHPARAAVKSSGWGTLLNSPTLNNIGYVVLIIKSQKNESLMPNEIAGNLTAVLNYDAEKVFGTGQHTYYVPLTSDDKWNSGNEYARNPFWNGNGFVRVNSIDSSGTVGVQLYNGRSNLFSSLNLKEGQTSSVVYFPGFYCKAGLKVKVEDVVGVSRQARLNVDGDVVWVTEGSKFLDNRCTVKTITPITSDTNITGTVDIYCNDGSRFSLSLVKNSGVVSVSSSAIEGKYVLDSKLRILNDSKSTGWILEKNLDGSYNISFDNYVVSNREIGGVSVLGDISFVNVGALGSWKSVASNLQDNYILSNNNFVLKTQKSVESTESNELTDKQLSSDVSSYFSESGKVTKELTDNYPNAKKDLEQSYAEATLFEQYKLAIELKQEKTARELLVQFVELYPQSSFVSAAKEKLFLMENYDFAKSYKSLSFSENKHYVSVELFDFSADKKKSVVLEVNTASKEYLEGEVITGFPTENDYVSISKISLDSVLFNSYNLDSKNVKTNSRTFSLKLQEAYALGDKRILVRDIKVDKMALISLVPQVSSTQSLAQFTYRIGIEKRNIKLSPKKTQEMIKNLNETIASLDKFNTRLGNLIKTWNGACLATTAVLMAKTLVSGFSGEATARSIVMKTYRERCSSQHPEMTTTQCYNKLSPDIDKDVTALSKQIDSVNADIAKIETNHNSGSSLFGGTTIDTTGALEDYRKTVIANNNGNKDFVSSSGSVDLSQVNSFEELRQIDLYLRTKGSVTSQFDLSLQSSLDSLLAPTFQEQTVISAQEKTANKLGGDSAGVIVLGTQNLKNEGVWEGKNASELSASLPAEISRDAAIQRISYGGASYVAVLSSISNGKLGVDRVYKSSEDGKSLIELGSSATSVTTSTSIADNNNPSTTSTTTSTISNQNEIEALKEIKQSSFVSASECNNPYKEARVIFYDSSSTSAQLPAVVPLDLNKGFYAYVSQTSGGILSSEKVGYQSSGQVSFFYICNVGKNGRMELRQGDDICQSFDINTYKDQEFCGLGRTGTKQIYDKSLVAIKRASQQYGKSVVNLDSIGSIETGSPVSALGDVFECQDFMSPKDCKILFNTCDPVICPSSRCNLGGAFPVASVVQSGVIGSLVLCLPNWNEGVAVPVCLTGVHAGLDSYNSILKSEQSCLQESLSSGKMIGICDQITSVYKCEFFWKQLAPFLETGFTKLVSLAYTGFQGARGGGEYMTIQDSFDNTKKGVDYFKNSYAENMFRAFNIRSIQEAGGTFCRAFIGTSIPSSADLLDNLLEPESPSQVYAWFSESTLNDATVPPTSHYKVYFHIYAGKDSGAQYRVYLKNPPVSSYYKQVESVSVDSGFIAKGESADKSLDMSFPSGYKEMCVVVNAKEYCGFTQVSTDFGLQYLEKKYVEEQNNTVDINSEKECVSGTPSAYTLINPNIQAGAEETLQPEIALRGIVRICSDKNPGENTDRTRWREVGNCGSSAGKCWLDTTSVKNDLDQLQNIRAGLDSIGAVDGSGVSTRLDTRSKLINVRNEIYSLESNKEVYKKVNDFVSRLDNLTKDVYIDYEQAEILSLKARVYRDVVKEIIDGKVENSGSADKTPTAPVSSPAVNTESEEKVEPGFQGDAKVDAPATSVPSVPGAPIEVQYILNGMEIFKLDGGSTGWSLIGDKDKGYNITLINVLGFPAIIGTISPYPDGVILFSNIPALDNNVESVASDLQDNYVFNSVDKKFVLKKSKAIA